MFCFKIKKALALCLCAITLSICFTGCKANKSKQKTTTNNTSEKFTVSGDNLSLDTTIEKVPDSIDEVVVKPYKIDVEKTKDIFLDKAEKVSYDVPDNTKEYYQDKEGNQIHLLDIVESEEPDVVEMMERTRQIEKLLGLVPKVLQERELYIVVHRYGLFGNKAMTQREIASAVGISRSYVSRIEKKALDKLKKSFCE